MNDRSATTSSAGPPISSGVTRTDIRAVVAGGPVRRSATARPVVRNRRRRPPPPGRRATAALGEAARQRAGVQTAAAGDDDVRESVERADELVRAPGCPVLIDNVIADQQRGCRVDRGRGFGGDPSRDGHPAGAGGGVGARHDRRARPPGPPTCCAVTDRLSISRTTTSSGTANGALPRRRRGAPDRSRREQVVDERADLRRERRVGRVLRVDASPASSSCRPCRCRGGTRSRRRAPRRTGVARAGGPGAAPRRSCRGVGPARRPRRGRGRRRGRRTSPGGSPGRRGSQGRRAAPRAWPGPRSAARTAPRARCAPDGTGSRRAPPSRSSPPSTHSIRRSSAAQRGRVARARERRRTAPRSRDLRTAARGQGQVRGRHDAGEDGRTVTTSEVACIPSSSVSSSHRTSSASWSRPPGSRASGGPASSSSSARGRARSGSRSRSPTTTPRPARSRS